jgi:hypothetical protein
MDIALTVYADHLLADWKAFPNHRAITLSLPTVSFKRGRTYIKVIFDGMAHSFIVIKPTKEGFQVGDILMAASFKAPATNFARGSVLTGTLDRVRWAGVV